ncbi:MAG: cytochrome P450 [Pseudolysinimonas sp.]
MSFDPAQGGCPFIDPERLFADLAQARSLPGLQFADPLGARVVTRYSEIVEALHDAETFSSTATVPELPEPWRARFAGRVPARGTLLGLDNPDHDRLRRAVNSFFVPRRIARFEPWITARAHAVIDGFVEEGTVDLKTAFALPMPLMTICHIVGLDPERWEWVGAALGFFLGPRDVHHVGTPEQKAALLLDLHEYVRAVMEERRLDRRDDLISHVWDVRDAGDAPMTDFEMLSLFPGLMLAGHETTSNLICTALTHLLGDRQLWQRAQRDDASRSEALEELFRFESAITGMKRRVTRDTELGGEVLRAGDEVFLAYAAGSRDPAAFTDPDTIDPSRGWSTPHLGFGQGIHACLGAPLARLLLRIELRVLYERLPDLRLAVPVGELRATAVSEGRGILALPLRWSPRPAGARPTAILPVADASAAPRASRAEIAVTVVAHRRLTQDVVELELRPDGVRVDWQPGAHIDLVLPSGRVRQYSLCGDPSSDTVRIAVLRERDGRGGSAEAHDDVHAGDRLTVRGPRRHFRLRTADVVLFVAGGIGITPLLPMLAEADQLGVEWRLLFLGRSRDRMPYLDDLLREHPDRVYAWPSDERGRYDLDNVWARLPRGSSALHACGPERLLTGLEESARLHGRDDDLVVERFAPVQQAHKPARACTIELARQGVTVHVPATESILDAVNRAGAGVLSTCREGTCGTCEVRVLEGTPEHRDSILTAEERLEGTRIMTCVSRCRGDRLVLDL